MSRGKNPQGGKWSNCEEGAIPTRGRSRIVCVGALTMGMRWLVLVELGKRRDYFVRQTFAVFVLLIMNMRPWTFLYMVVQRGGMTPCGHKDPQYYERKSTHGLKFIGFPDSRSSFLKSPSDYAIRKASVPEWAAFEDP